MKKFNFFTLIIIGLIVSISCQGYTSPITPRDADTVFSNQYIVLAYNDLGMHCMNKDFSQMAILPPFNNLYAQVIRRGEDPDIIQSGVTVNYSFPNNTHSADKTNFWTYLHNLHINIPNNIGLTGHGLSGQLVPATGRNDWVVDGIPLTPTTDKLVNNPYQLALVTVKQGSTEVARTYPVVPVSWEMSCNLCHSGSGITTEQAILQKHDALHGTHLDQKNPKPVICGSCHRQEPLVPLGLTGNQSLPSLSHAMHSSHSTRMGPVETVTGGVVCYACHPGVTNHCQRDIHSTNGMNCFSCHDSMDALAVPTRHPWIDEPRCDSCHSHAGWQFEQPGTLYRNSIGHMGVHCEACHGSPHAITPTTTAADNIQALWTQGVSGTINNCLVCHTQTPDEGFIHRQNE
jgi:hypothetical protein